MKLTTALAVCMSISTFALAAETPPASSEKKPVELVAHRGESHDAPENTLAAFNLAWQRGVPSVELDVHLTKDGKLICIHDATTKRTAGTDLAVKEQTAEALQKLDVGSWKSPQFAGEKMPLLDDALKTIPPGRRLFIEVKVGPESVPELVRCLERAGKSPEQTPIISFNLETCRQAKKALPKVKVYYLSSPKQDKETKKWKPTNEELIATAKTAGLDGLDLNYKGPIDAAFVQAVKKEGLAFYVWTIDDPAAAKAMIEAGAEAVTTNRGQWMAEQLKAKL